MAAPKVFMDIMYIFCQLKIFGKKIMLILKFRENSPINGIGVHPKTLVIVFREGSASFSPEILERLKKVGGFAKQENTPDILVAHFDSPVTTKTVCETISALSPFINPSLD